MSRFDQCCDRSGHQIHLAEVKFQKFLNELFNIETRPQCGNGMRPQCGNGMRPQCGNSMRHPHITTIATLCSCVVVESSIYLLINKRKTRYRLQRYLHRTVHWRNKGGHKQTKDWHERRYLTNNRLAVPISVTINTFGET